jgi:hypothetical protein
MLDKSDTDVVLCRNNGRAGVEVVGEEACPAMNQVACNKCATATIRVVFF